MSIPPNNSERHITSINASDFDKKSIYLTDARRVGIMLRDRRLTLRSHSALTRFILEATNDRDFVLKATSIGDRSYVRIGDKNAFYAHGSREEATVFQIQVTPIGTELYLSNDRPAVFDGFYDVHIGKWSPELSSIPILIHLEKDLGSIWAAFGKSGASPGIEL